MKRNRRAAKPGFTLIELLTVIAIIAILASILFPVFGRVREATRQATTMEQMHSVYVALKQYHEDNGKYPPVLYGFAEVDTSRATNPAGLPAGTPYSGNNSPAPIGIDQVIFRPLIGQQHYLREKGQFLSADHVQNDPKAITTNVIYPDNTPLKGTTVTYTQAMYRNSGLEDQYANLYNSMNYNPIGGKVFFYAYDSYDSGPVLRLDTNGNIDKSNTQDAELHYSLDWTGYTNRVSAINDRWKGHIARNQLKYNNAAPEDSTVVTWSTDHATVGGSDHIPVLFLNGRVKAVNVKEFYDKGPLGFYSPTLQ